MNKKFSWLDKNEYPFEAIYFQVNGHQLHYIDEGTGEVILFVHGTPSWSFDFRNQIKALSKHYRCIAIDHIGFGLSDKPADYDYSTKHHARTLTHFIDYLQLKDVTLVLHDFGGPIGLHVGMQHPEKIKRLIMMNSWIGSSAHDPEFIKFSKILKSPLLPFLYRYFNFSPRFLLPASFGNKKLPKKLLEQYTSPFANKNERYGTLAFAKSLLNDQDWFEELWSKRGLLTNKPMLLIWGMKDKFATEKYLNKFKAGFPNADVLRLETSGHFPQEEESEQVAKALANFCNEN
jgi:pimeloyl-ACP methyl ester carboxylesterase